MKAGPPLVLALTLVGGAAFVLYTLPALPDRIATHFGADNMPNAWMTRDGYRLYMLSFASAFPLLITLAVAGLPRLFPGSANIPNRDYWLGGERRGEALGFLAERSCWLGVLIGLLGDGVHTTIVLAHNAQPVELPALPFIALLCSFFLALLWWMFSVFRFFSRTGGARRRRAR
jgi:hypothetical protein